MYVMIFYNTENPRDKMNSTRIGNRAENPPNIAGSLQVDGAWRLRIPPPPPGEGLNMYILLQ